ncbi:hypothetical protein EUTSA_v10001877mg [Eutrema salsugineum]|uniref:Zinc finger CCCH domain-containing protein 19-like n=1 Tax=Eutrema salsugineum TaxID=72664 RepID=V4LIL8_EUTSA|nr:zinc finger CCCH domain-containing protein 19 [Eutrema salsugineum]ESQ50380.1 hypothetical protein EUTSA_v10001877mg [Eutrema salsugineum]
MKFAPLEGGKEERNQKRKGDSVAECRVKRIHFQEKNKEVSMEEEPPPSQDISASGVNGVDSLKVEEKREEESTQAVKIELGNTESEKEKFDVMEEETTAQAASLEDIVSVDLKIPDEKEIASVAGFTEIPSQDEKSLEELQMGQGAKDLSDEFAKEDVGFTVDAMGNQVLKETEEEEEKPDAVTVLETQAKLQEEDDEVNEVSEKNKAPMSDSSAGKEDVEKDLEVGNSVEIHVPEAAQEVETDVKYAAGIEEEGDGMDGVRDVRQTADLEETRELSEELAKADETKIAEVSEETETIIEEENEEKNDDMTDLAEDVETHKDYSAALSEEGRDDHEEMGMKEMIKTQEEAVVGKVDRAKVAEMSEETQTRMEVEDEEKDEDMNDVAEDVETHRDSSATDIEEESENNDEIEMTDPTDTQEEIVMGETRDEELEEVEEENKSAKGKRKRVRNTKTVKGTGKKKEEDVCFMCFDGGDLVLCDRRGCPKAYHPSCVDRDEAFFRSKGNWNCGWHLCSKCEKTATYLCYTCMFSLCKCCAKDAVFFCVRGNKGLCETCMETVKLIEKKEQEKEPAQLDFDDKTSWEYLFKDYWLDLKSQLSLSPEELDQAKSPQKGNESHAGKQGITRETDYVTDGGSDSDSSPKKRKTRSRLKSSSAEKILSPANKSSSGETMKWASKELLDVVAHMRRGDISFLPHSEVHALLLDYIKRYNLRDPRRKSQVICDSKLQNLFGKSHVGHFEMLNLLDTHFLDKEQQQVNDIQGSIDDTEPDHVDVDENFGHPVKSGKDKKRKTRKKSVRKGGCQSNLDDFAAIDMHNINLIYLRRSLVEDLLGDSTAFEEKVTSAFVRLKIPGIQKQDLYRLVQVIGTPKAPEPYKVGKKTTDFELEILNLDKKEVISIDVISNQDFTEDECMRLKQSIKCGLINRLSMGDIQEKAIALQEVRIKNLLEAEILRFSHLRDRASDMGHRKELRECVERLQKLKSPEERQRRLEEIPGIHGDPKMDPNCESEDEDGKEEKEKERNMRPRSSSFNRRGRDPISPRRGGFSSNESWTSTSNFSNNRELSRSYSSRGSTGREDYLGSSEENVSESMWTLGRKREMPQSSGSEKPRSVSIPEPAPRSSHTIVQPELSPRIVPENLTAPPAVVPQPAPMSNESEKMWHYKDPSGKVQGSFSMAQLRKWNNTGYFPAKLEIWKATESPLDSILLTDALAGLFQKQTQPVDNSYEKSQVAAYSGQPSQTAPSILDIPRNSQDTWSSGGSLPSPTPNQITTPTAKRRNFESRWSPTKPSAQSCDQSINMSLAQSGPSQVSRTDIPMVVNSAGALQPNTHRIPGTDMTNSSNNHYGSAPTLPSPTPAGGKQSWSNMQTYKFDSHGRGGGEAPSSSASYVTATPSILPSQSQQGYPQSDPWRVPIPSQPNTQSQARANNEPWGMNNSQNAGQPQAPQSNQNSGWGQGTVDPNMGWAGPVQAGMNVNWAAPSVPPTGQGMPNPGWGGSVQAKPQPQAYPNTGWGTVAGQGQAPGSTTGSGWMQPGQGMQPGNSNQNWGTQNQIAIPSWGNQQNQNRDSGGYGWNRQSSGQNNFKGQRVCKFYQENGHCRKGASCNYLHN